VHVDILPHILLAYAVTFLLVEAAVLGAPRRYLVSKTPHFSPGKGHKHFFECRMCVGFWICLLLLSIFGWSFTYAMAVYGGSYFLATQER
jgi:hypothetical protein